MTSKEYHEMFFVPALKEWQATGRLPDLFERYGLSLEESNPDVIKNQIKAVRGFWGSFGNSSNHGAQTLTAILRAEEEKLHSENVLLDPTERTNAANKACGEREATESRTLKQVDLHMALAGTKGYITPAERKVLEKRFSPDLVEKVLRRARLQVEERSSAIPKDKSPDEELWRRVRDHLRVLNTRDLYTFLDPEPWDIQSKEEWKTKHKLSYELWRSKKNDLRKVAAKDLLAVIKTELIGGDPSSYQEALRWEQLEPMRQLVNLVALGKRINNEQFQLLVGNAREHSIHRPEDYVLELLEEKGVSVFLSEPVEFFNCPNCLRFIKGKRTRCDFCGFAFTTSCRRCGKEIPSMSHACSKCNFAAADYTQAVQLARTARRAIAEGRLVWALDLVREAEELWKAEGEVREVRKLAEDAVAAAKVAIESIIQLRSERRIFEAAKRAAKLLRNADDWPGPSGETVATLTKTTHEDLRRAEALLSEARLAEANREWNKAVLFYQRALALAADSDEAIQGLVRRNPEAPPRAQAEVQGNGVYVHWDPSPAVGEIEYLVTRHEGQEIAAFDDKSVVCTTKRLSFHDLVLKGGELFYYAVFVRRHGAISKPCLSAGVLVALEAADVRAEGRDGFVRLQWAIPSANATIRVTKRVARAPENVHDGQLLTADAAGLKDISVQNGSEYFYRVSLVYRHPLRGTIPTTGVVVRGTPQTIPKPILDLRVNPTSDGVTVSWTPLNFGEVEIYRSQQRTDWQVGSNVEPAKRTKTFRLLNATASEAYDAPGNSAAVWYTPVTLSGDFAIAGEPRHFRAIPEVADLKAEDFGQYLQLRWKWPAGCEAVRVLWRPDRYPDDPNDPEADSKELTQSAYFDAGRMKLENAKPVRHYFTAFAVALEQGESLFSTGRAKGAKAVWAPITSVGYSIRQGVPQKGEATLVLTAAKAIRLGPLRLVAKDGVHQPLNAETGAIVVSLPAIDLKPGESFQRVFDLPKNRPSYLRLFSAEGTPEATVRLEDPPSHELKVT